ncbi:MAG TPA: glycosyltransferase family 2 protein [Candidatus Gastranaerophilaceae bacterium]|nr:glycosyltransferase family 2 protein [Candidatus Gastranaerophilaceae bacterium]HPT40891.1 glycosyltransferase family 2 protein [Candidatus Gastranaerophilaceae bacterium]
MKISVITVCYNAKNDIEDTIQSVFKQTALENIEYIIIDGNSTDGTKEIIKKYKDKISKYISESDTGIYNAMNKGIKLATGDFIQFLNAGDFYINEKVVEDFLPHLQNAKSEIIFGNLFAFNKYNGDVVRINENIIDKYLFNYQSIPHPCTFFRREIFEKVGLYNENYRIVSDFEWYLKYFNEYGGSYLYVDKYAIIFDLNGICSSAKFADIHRKERKEVVKKYYSGLEHFIYKVSKIIFKRQHKKKYFRKMLAIIKLNKFYKKESEN